MRTIEFVASGARNEQDDYWIRFAWAARPMNTVSRWARADLVESDSEQDSERDEEQKVAD